MTTPPFLAVDLSTLSGFLDKNPSGAGWWKWLAQEMQSHPPQTVEDLGVWAGVFSSSLLQTKSDQAYSAWLGWAREFSLLPGLHRHHPQLVLSLLSYAAKNSSPTGDNKEKVTTSSEICVNLWHTTTADFVDPKPYQSLLAKGIMEGVGHHLFRAATRPWLGQVLRSLDNPLSAWSHVLHPDMLDDRVDSRASSSLLEMGVAPSLPEWKELILGLKRRSSTWYGRTKSIDVLYRNPASPLWPLLAFWGAHQPHNLQEWLSSRNEDISEDDVIVHTIGESLLRFKHLDLHINPRDWVRVILAANEAVPLEQQEKKALPAHLWLTTGTLSLAWKFAVANPAEWTSRERVDLLFACLMRGKSTPSQSVLLSGLLPGDGSLLEERWEEAWKNENLHPYCLRFLDRLSRLPPDATHWNTASWQDRISRCFNEYLSRTTVSPPTALGARGVRKLFGPIWHQAFRYVHRQGTLTQEDMESWVRALTCSWAPQDSGNQVLAHAIQKAWSEGWRDKLPEEKYMEWAKRHADSPYAQKMVLLMHQMRQSPDIAPAPRRRSL